jgi:hypothetical protein
MFSASVPARISVRCGRSRSTGAALDVQVVEVGAAEEHRAARHVDGPGQHLGQGGLAGAGAADQRVRAAARERQADVAQRRRAPESASPYRKVRSRTTGRRRPAAALGRFLRHVAQQLHPAPGAERVLQLGHHPGDVLQGAAEAEREQPHRGQPGAVDVPGDQRPRADHDQAAISDRVIAPALRVTRDEVVQTFRPRTSTSRARWA